jgi:hypothetical protein
VLMMNAFNLLTAVVCIAPALVSCAADETGDRERRRPRQEVERAEPPGKTNTLPEKAAAELCNEAGNVKYAATWEKGKVTLTASGSHGTAGYRVFFEQSMLMIYPPEFSLKHQRPRGAAATVMTPFSVKTSFKADEKPQAVTVHDAKGRNRVPVR